MKQSDMTARCKQILIAALVVIGCWGSGSRSAAAPTSEAQGTRHGDVVEGTLFLRGEGNAESVKAPTLKTDVNVHVTGLIARVAVHQEFTNPGTTWAEGIYVFPLPETAAVDHLRMRIGERVIEGLIKERTEAKKTYEQAKVQGKRASLLEQERPNIFTSSVANIAPDERIIVEIEYQETLRYDQGRVSLRFPMVVGPRYIPGAPVPASGHDADRGSGWSPDTDRVPDASRVTPPVLHPSNANINPVTMALDLAPGFPLGRIESLSHPITTTTRPDGQVRVTLKEGAAFADRDFVLVWEAAADRAPEAAVFTERVGADTYVFLMMMPPTAPVESDARRPREVVFVIDTSGSMFGESINQAKAALKLALTRLTSQDRFNIIQFNHLTHRLFTQAEPVTADTLGRAQKYVDQLAANGGTEMLPALKMALDGQELHSRLRQVIFLTDGQIGNENELFREIGTRLGDSRLFTVGIGSAPNSFFMRKAAEFGRGTFTYIGNTGQVQDAMERLFRKLEQPAVTDLVLDMAGSEGMEMLPARIPDLYVGEPVVLAARFDRLPERAALTGRIGETTWKKELRIQNPEERPGIAVHWARQKIAALMDRQRRGDENNVVRQTVLDLALRHHLVTKYTSLVAVDLTPIKPDGAAIATHALKTNLPHGQDYEHIFGLPRTASPGPVHLLLGLVALLGAALCVGLRRVRA